MSTSNGASSSFIIIDGADLRSIEASLPDPLSSSSSAVAGSQVIEVAESKVAQFMRGYALPEGVRSSALRRIGVSDVGGFEKEEFEKEVAVNKVQEYVYAIADQLEEDPLVLSILDGRELRRYLEDEDDFAMLAEDLFTELDAEDTGKIKRCMTSKALDLLGVDMGVPSPSEFSQLNDLLTKHGAEGDDELGQSQFAEVLQSILQEIADTLAKNHTIINTNLKIFNGSKIRKLLCNEKQLTDLTEDILEANPNGQAMIESSRKYIGANGMGFGVPPLDVDETAALYDAVFARIESAEKSDSGWGLEQYRETVRDILRNFAERLEADPVFLSRGSEQKN